MTTDTPLYITPLVGTPVLDLALQRMPHAENGGDALTALRRRVLESRMSREETRSFVRETDALSRMGVSVLTEALLPCTKPEWRYKNADAIIEL